MGFYRYLTAGGTDSPEVPWKAIDFSAGTIFGTAACVTARTSSSLTIDPSEAASAYLDNSPNTSGQYFFSSTAVDLSAWPANTPCILAAEVVRGDSAPSHGTMIGVGFHNTADPTVATAFSGTWIRRKTNGDADAWAWNNWGQIGGYSNSFANRQRATMIVLCDADRLEAISYRTRYLDADGNSGNRAQNILSSDWPGAFNITGGLWVSVIAGTYQPNGTPDAASVHTPRTVRYAVMPFGANQ